MEAIHGDVYGYGIRDQDAISIEDRGLFVAPNFNLINHTIMKNKIKIASILLWSLSTILVAQENTKKRFLSLESGFTTMSILENRFTTNTDKSIGFYATIKSEKHQKNRINSSEWFFSKNRLGTDELTNFSHINWHYKYTHFRRLSNKEIVIGGYVDNGGLFSVAKGEWSSNNLVSYTFWFSSGIALRGKKEVEIKGKKLFLNYESSLPLLGYVIRPAYAHPYFESYLKDGTFNFNQEGMWKAYFTSGKIRTVNSFINFKTKFGVAMPLGKETNTLGLQYAWEYFYVGNDRPIWQVQHRLAVVFKIAL